MSSETVMIICKLCKETKTFEKYNVARRNTTGRNTVCKACMKISNKKAYDANPEKEIARCLKYYNKNREARNLYADAQRELYPEAHAARAAAYYKGNRDACRESSAKYRRENRGVYTAHAAKRRARRFNATPEHTNELDTQITKILYVIARGLSKMNRIEYHVDHRKPLVKGGAHHWMNLQILTAEENLKKGAKYE